MSVQPFLIGEGWIEVRDGDETALTLFRRHYSYKPTVRPKKGLAVGPGFKLLLISADGMAVCAWRKEKHRKDDQTGVNCSIFRREGGGMASRVLAEARQLAWARWPGERLFTFVDPREVTPTWRAGRPTWGHCFYQDGWVFEGLTQKRLHILARYPNNEVVAA
jgi:hypothetical protein